MAACLTKTESNSTRLARPLQTGSHARATRGVCATESHLQTIVPDTKRYYGVAPGRLLAAATHGTSKELVDNTG
eukprot:8876536-Lingulodinium_polyedra.AAC.1